MEDLIRYRDHGIPTGSFLRAVLDNDLKQSFALADLGNRETMFAIVKWCHTELPAIAWGSPETVDAWLARDWRLS